MPENRLVQLQRFSDLTQPVDDRLVERDVVHRHEPGGQVRDHPLEVQLRGRGRGLPGLLHHAVGHVGD